MREASKVVSVAVVLHRLQLSQTSNVQAYVLVRGCNSIARKLSGSSLRLVNHEASYHPSKCKGVTKAFADATLVKAEGAYVLYSNHEHECQLLFFARHQEIYRFLPSVGQ